MKAYYRITITVLCISLLICLLSFSSLAADAVTEEIPVTWRRIDGISSILNYAGQNIYYFRQGGNTQYPIDVTYAMTTSYNRYYGLLTQRTLPVPADPGSNFLLQSIYWGNNREIYPYYNYIDPDNYPNRILTGSTYPLAGSPVYFVGTGQRNFATWKQKIELNSDYPVSDSYSYYDYYSLPSLVVLRLFADVNINVFHDDFDYLTFSYDYTTYYPTPSWIQNYSSLINKLLEDPMRYGASIGYVEHGYYVPLVFSDYQFTSFGPTFDDTSKYINTTQSIKFNLPSIVSAYNQRFGLSLTQEEFVNDFPTLTVACSYWHIVFDYLDEGVPVASMQYFGRYNIPEVYLSNFNPVAVGFSQVNERLDQINDQLFIVQDEGDVQIINNLADKISESTGVVSDFDSAVAALDSIIGSVQPETSVFVNAFSTDPLSTGANAIFSNGIDLKGFMGSQYIMPLILIAVSVSVISWVIYGKKGG